MSTENTLQSIIIADGEERAAFVDALKRAIKRIHRDNPRGQQTLSQLMTVYAHQVGYNQWSLFVQDISQMSWQRFDRIQEIFDQKGVLPRIPAEDDGEIWFDDYWFDASGD